ncbi:prenyltransferase and squalene oxidase repeat family protein [Ditylenchus destructor]|uniref:Prenyltransferase and squalene oxidase repeat family protein n=1 Tax=Ditylenchus destructor TaxID=166010 RepID=A0AAD4NGX5_9BILA|nr:prenyltransferase and squalene oxidase repeat family protein [Ditylenchus destructor]
MTFFSPRAHDHGCIQFGCNSYGGLAYRTSSFDIPSMSSDHFYDATQPDHLIPKANTDFPRFISEHNLALYWRRPGLFPRTAGFPMPLLCTAMDARNGIRNRPPGCLRPDSAIIRYRQRNLLTGEIPSTSDEHLTLWAINDLSDHKTLLQYNIEFDMKYRGDKDDQLLRFVTPGFPSEELKLSSEAMELRAMVYPNVTGKLFVRTKRR